jgi:2'-5' RNA ligase
VALELPDTVRKAIVAWRERLPAAAARSIRAIPAESLHVTLCFLGWQEDAEVDAIGATCSIVAPEPQALLCPRAAVWLPPRRPRVLAVELDDLEGTLGRVQRSLSSALAAGGWYEPEKRRYLAHVTVARVPAGRRELGSGREHLPEPPRGEFCGSRVVLYRSRLLRSGARYEALASVDLAG